MSSYDYDKLVNEHQKLKDQYDRLQALYLKLAAGKVTIALENNQEQNEGRSPYVQSILEELFPL